MPDSLLRDETIWMYGVPFIWHVYRSSVDLDPRQLHREGHPPVPTRNQKNQICLHWTAGNGAGSTALNTWNTNAAAAPQKFSSAHFIVELAQDRFDAANPYADVLQVRYTGGNLVETDMQTFHGGPINESAIGIEITNVGWDWNSAAGEPFNGAGNNKRPTDQNHFLHIDNPAFPTSNMGAHHDFQYFQNEQYLALILLLRYLCIKHRIPRRFLGDTIQEKFQRWWDDLGADMAVIRSRLMRFRGILSHMNCSGPPASKECGGPALNRNRLFRGIIDEWWMPLQLDGTERPYYMGPFDAQSNKPDYIRFTFGQIHQELFHDADLDALQETKSYFDFDQLPLYYAQTEDAARGGSFPIGVNRIWHGGVHFEPALMNNKVYAAASGTIVAARLCHVNNVEVDPQYGSQRFVLIRHCVYLDEERDPADPNPAGAKRINYGGNPHYVFTLYMHLDPFSNLEAPHFFNPPWFNYWLRHRTAQVDPTQVFYPQVPVLAGGATSGVPVSVGDWIGFCGQYRQRDVLHFELMSKDEFTMGPWSDPNLSVKDNDQNLLCDTPAINRFVQSRTGQQIDEVDIIRAAPQLRNVKSYHKSEWALTGPDALIGLIAKPEMREAKWKSLKPFMWVADAVAACPDLANQLCDATGMMWHYHPVTFMEFVNRLVLKGNEQPQATDDTSVNVEIDGEFLTNFVHWAGGAFQQQAATAAPAVQPYAVSNQNFAYHFSRAELACLVPGPHAPGPTPPTATHFHTDLLDIMETARQIFGASITVSLSYLCDGHNTGLNTGLCALSTTGAHAIHNAGLAVDIRPSNATPDSCRRLWQAVETAIATYDAECAAHAGEPSRADVGAPASASAEPFQQRKLVAGTALTNAEAHAFLLHIQLQQPASSVVWECYVQQPSLATAVRIQTGGIVGTFRTQQDALAGTIGSATALDHLADGSWEGWIRPTTQAIRVRLQPYAGSPCVIGTYNDAEAAETEKGWDFAWPVQVTP